MAFPKKKIKKESQVLKYLREQRETYARQVQKRKLGRQDSSTEKLGSHRKSAQPKTEGDDSAT